MPSDTYLDGKAAEHNGRRAETDISILLHNARKALDDDEPALAVALARFGATVQGTTLTGGRGRGDEIREALARLAEEGAPSADRPGQGATEPEAAPSMSPPEPAAAEAAPGDVLATMENATAKEPALGPTPEPVPEPALAQPATPDLCMAQRHVALVTGSPDAPVVIRTLSDNPKAKQQCKEWKGTIVELWPAILKRQACGGGVFLIVNEGDADSGRCSRTRIAVPDWKRFTYGRALRRHATRSTSIATGSAAIAPSRSSARRNGG